MLGLAGQMEMKILSEAILRILLSCFLGGIIGYERERKNHAAGLRTHLIVCLTSCLIMVLSFIWYGETMNDTSRLAQGALSGIGFLGAGTILRDGSKVRGLTTAASIWLVATLGLIVGAGLYLISLITTGILIFVLIVLAKLERKFIRTFQKFYIKIETEDAQSVVSQIYDLVEAYHMELESLEIDNGSLIELQIFSSRNEHRLSFMQKLSLLKGVTGLKSIHKI